MPGEIGTLHHWAAAVGVERVEPMPLQTFLRYADWFRSRFVPESDPADVARAERAGGGFELTTIAGDRVAAARLVVAVGAIPFPRVPEPLSNIDDPRVVYTVGNTHFEAMAGERVVVLGGGQSGLESAALAARAGAASVEIVVRSEIRWFASREHWQPRSALRRRLYRLAYPVIGFGPPPINRFVLYPDLFAKLPLPAREYLNRRLLRPGGSPWIRSQVDGVVVVTSHRSLVAAEVAPEAIRLVLDDGTTREADRVVVCTGSRFDLERLTWLAEPIRREIACTGGWPLLDRAFRTSNQAIQFVGYAAERRFGPLSRFIAGTTFSAERAASVHLDRTTKPHKAMLRDAGNIVRSATARPKP